MILTIDSESKKIFANIQSGDRMDNYECVISACENPDCTCQTTHIDLIPVQSNNEKLSPLPPRTVKLDIGKRSLDYKNKRKIPKADLKFAKQFLRELDRDDFQLLHKAHFTFKNNITEKAPIDAIDAYFEYDEVEFEGLMYAYNDVLPFGDQLHMTVEGEECLIIDQYCLLPKCTCTDTILNIFPVDKAGEIGKELCVLSLKYKNKKWKTIEQRSSSVNLKTSRAAITAQIPNIYQQLKKRHLKLKAIYAHCKKKHYSPDQGLEMPKVGRNDPCPCGSGKKFKKCCLN